MKKTFIFASLATAILVLGSCGSNATEAGNSDSAAQASAAAVTYKIDAAASTLGWHGSKVAGVDPLNGFSAVCVSVSVSVCVCVFVCTAQQRSRDHLIYLYVCMYVYTHIHIYI